jgi:hypothetical protein
VVSAADPARSLISVSYTGAAIFLSSSSSFILTRAEWTPFQTHCYSENLVPPEIEPGTSRPAARKSDHETKEAVPMELTTSRKAASWAASQEFLNVLWKPKVYYRVHKRPPLGPYHRILCPYHMPQYYAPIHMLDVCSELCPVRFGVFTAVTMKNVVF